MKKPDLVILCVGKIKEAFWNEAKGHYLGLLEKIYNVKILEIRDGNGKLQPELIKRKEGENLKANYMPGFLRIGLWENGRLYNSFQFAEQMRAWENTSRKLCFLLGGPFGLADSVLEECDFLLSLSPMTWPHELARVLLLEQIYRAATINQRRPYHH